MVTVGVLGALMAPATMALVTDIAPDTERGVHGGVQHRRLTGVLAGIVGGGWIADRRGFQDAFAIAGGAELVLAAVALPALLALRDRRSE